MYHSLFVTTCILFSPHIFYFVRLFLHDKRKETEYDAAFSSFMYNSRRISPSGSVLSSSFFNQFCLKQKKKKNSNRAMSLEYIFQEDIRAL